MRKCPNCKREIADGSMFCEYCGYQIKRSKKPLWIVLSVASLVIALVCLVLLLFNMRGNDNGGGGITPIDPIIGTGETKGTNEVVGKGNQYVFINANELRLRYGPSLESEMLRKPDGSQRYATRNEKFLYKGETADFYKIEYYDGREFWVARQYANCVQGSPNDDWETERRIRGFVADYSMTEELPSGESRSMVRQLFAPQVERYFDARNETVDEVAQHFAKYDEVFGVYGKHSKVRWNTVSYYKSGNRYMLTYVEDYTIDRFDESKYSIFVLEKHFELNSDFKVVSVYDVQRSRSTK